MLPAIDLGRLFRDLPAPYMMLDRDFRFVAANDRYCEVTGRTREQLIGREVGAVFPEIADRIASMRAALDRAFAGEEVSLPRVPFRIGKTADGQPIERFWDICILPVYDQDGKIVAIAQKASDVTDTVETERMRQTVLEELDHRIKNVLAKVSAIANRSASNSHSVAEFLAKFRERLDALARTQQLLLKSDWDSVPLRSLLDDEIAPYGAGEDRRIAIDGPELVVRGRVAQALGMAFHELATNAAKHGALGQAGAALEVRWAKDGNQDVIIDWVESGVTMSGQGSRPGFGSTVLDRLTPLETGGSVDRTLGADGLRCRISLPHASGRGSRRAGSRPLR